MLDDGSFTLIDHLKDNLTNMEAVERIADHFARISQEYPAINIDNLPHEGQLKLNSRLDEMNFPIVDELDVYNMIKKTKKSNAGSQVTYPRHLFKILLLSWQHLSLKFTTI